MFHKRKPPIGARPGTLAIPENAAAPQIHVFDYGPDTLREQDVADPDELVPYLDSPQQAWIDVQGLGDEAVLRRIAELCNIHPLALEDAVNAPQRAKSELWADSQLIIARTPLLEDGKLVVPQIAIFLATNYVVTIQERRFGFFEPVRARLRDGLGRPIRNTGPDYLTYALIDALVDRYYPVVEGFALELEEIESQMLERSDPALLGRLHALRRHLMVLRRSGWPQREMVSRLARDETPYVTETVRVFFRDTDDHMRHAIEAADSAREMATSLTELYLSFESHRANEIMKVLTIMASIFIPLTFVAGIYGMNFEAMPELRHRWGYPAALGLMGIVAAGMLAFFRRRGWLGPPH